MKRIAISLLSIFFINTYGQYYTIPENIKAGVFFRPGLDFFKYYNGASVRGGEYSIRNTNGYNGGVMIRSKLYSVFEGFLSLGFGETKYKPDIQLGSSRLWQVGIRAFQLNLGGELQVKESGKVIPGIMVGLQMISVRTKTEIVSQPLAEEYSWPNTRVMPQVGLNYHIKLFNKTELTLGAGMRINWNHNLGYEFGMNQLFGNIAIVRQIKEW